MPNDSAPTPALRPLLQYDGKIGELYRIYLVNLLLTIVTLGIWRFWAITRMRRYVWSRTSMAGDRFEYDGTGKQLFVSFLLAGLVLVGLAVVAGIATVVLQRFDPRLAVIPIALLYGVFILLALSAPFSAQRYRLGHTLWRGIRAGMEGSALKYGLRSAFYFLLVVLSLYQLIPWATLRLQERRISASFLGDLRMQSRGRPGRLYPVFLATFIGMVILGVLIAAVVYNSDRAGFHAMVLVNAHPRGVPPDPELQRQAGRVVYVMLAGYAAFFLGLTLISSVYSAAYWRHLLSHTTAGNIVFGSNVTALTIAKLVAGNFGIILCTIGFGYPIVLQRNVRFFTTNVLASATPDPASIHQSDRPVPSMGEGMFQQLDGGGGFL